MSGIERDYGKRAFGWYLAAQILIAAAVIWSSGYFAASDGLLNGLPGLAPFAYVVFLVRRAWSRDRDFVAKAAHTDGRWAQILDDEVPR